MDLVDIGPLKARGVLLLHGSPMPAESVLPLATALAGQHRVLVPDLPGYGESAPVRDIFADTEKALAALLADHGIVSVDLIGVSLGAYRALRLAASGVVRVRKLALLGGFAALGDGERARFRDLATKIRASEDVCDEFLAQALPVRDGRVDLASRCREWVHAAQKRSGWAVELDAAAAAEDLRPRLRDLRVPILAIHGEADALVAAAHSVEIGRSALDVAVEMLPCGHLVLDELPERVIPRVRKFLS
jgi:pimeloyl-ACP methyl ester carboxylesterase